MSILGLQADGTRASVDLTEKITQLEETVADARDACSHDLRQEAYEQCQHNVAEQEDKLYWAYDDLQTEIEKLEEAQTQLTSECKTGKKESCSKLNQVNARLKKDTNFLNLPSFLHGVK